MDVVLVADATDTGSVASESFDRVLLSPDASLAGAAQVLDFTFFVPAVEGATEGYHTLAVSMGKDSEGAGGSTVVLITAPFSDPIEVFGSTADSQLLNRVKDPTPGAAALRTFPRSSTELALALRSIFFTPDARLEVRYTNLTDADQEEDRTCQIVYGGTLASG